MGTLLSSFWKPVVAILFGIAMVVSASESLDSIQKLEKPKCSMCENPATKVNVIKDAGESHTVYYCGQPHEELECWSCQSPPTRMVVKGKHFVYCCDKPKKDSDDCAAEIAVPVDP